MTRLEAHNLIVRRGGRAIVSDVSLTMGGGMFVALIGPNGAGKSTLMSLLGGLLAPDSGSVTLDDERVGEIERKALARRRAYLPQNPRAEWPVSAERLVALGLLPQLPAFGGLPEALRCRVADVLQRFAMAGQADQPVTTLSGGELARVMLARAMVGNPDLLLVDEPLAGLDPRHALESVARLRAFAGEGRLVVTALQELTLAARFATHVAVMQEGQLAAFGPVADVLTAPLLSEVFAVEACVAAPGTPGAVVDFVLAAPVRG